MEIRTTSGTAERRNGGTAERRNGGTAERRNGGTAERRNGGTAERRNGGTAERRNGGTAEHGTRCKLANPLRPLTHFPAPGHDSSRTQCDCAGRLNVQRRT